MTTARHETRAGVKARRLALGGALSVGLAACAGVTKEGEHVGAEAEAIRPTSAATDTDATTSDSGDSTGVRSKPQPPSALPTATAKPIGTGLGSSALPPPDTFGTGYAPLVSAPAYFSTNSRGFGSLGLGWYETGNPPNAETHVYRRTYDVYGDGTGAPSLIFTLTRLPTGPVSYVDTAPAQDRLNCYQIEESAGGPCVDTPGGYSCVSSPWKCAYARANPSERVGRAQLRLRVSNAATAAAPRSRIHVQLQDPTGVAPEPTGNSTWLDSTEYDFTAGSDRAYDLELAHVSYLTDITGITISTPDSDGLCLNEIELLINNERAFFKSYGDNGTDCAWVSEGAPLKLSFADLRLDPAWQTFAPPNLLPPELGQHSSFVGFRREELIHVLDAAWGNVLKDPASGLGAAGLLDGVPTTTTRIDERTLHVEQAFTAKGGALLAHPSYDLVIHFDSTCGSAAYCIKLENLDPHADYTSWVDVIPILGVVINAIEDHLANDAIEGLVAALPTMPLPDLSVAHFCFPGDATDPKNHFSDRGFGSGSIAVCW
jgi:hypothetical protein